MVHTCSVEGCRSSWYPGCNIRFHLLPSDKTRRKEWLTCVPIKSEKYVKGRICSLHFSRFDYNENNRLNRLAVPYFPGYTSSSSTNIAMSEARIQIQNTVGDSSVKECRACLQILNGDTISYNIFDTWMPPWEGMAENIAKDLANITNVQILETDTHSKIICETCWQLLLNACNFVFYVRNNDEVLKQRYLNSSNDMKEISNLNTSNERIWPKPIQVDKPSPFNMENNPLDVEIKQEVLSDDEYLANGSYVVPIEEITPDLNLIKIEPEEMIQPSVAVNGSILPLPSLEPEKSHVSNGDIDNGEDHLIPKIKEEPLSEEDNDQVHLDLSLECMLCSKIFNSVSGLKAHVIAQHSYKSVKRKRTNSLSPDKKKCKYVCAICRRTFTTSTDLMVHETCHNKSVCYGCNESFDTFEDLTEHRRICKAVASKESNKLVTLSDVLRTQQKEQTNLSCTLCNEKFTHTYYMKIHQEVHHSNVSDIVVDNMKIEAVEDADWQ